MVTGVTPLWVVMGLAMGPAVALGLARFAYALLLPSMREDLGWSFADAGAMNTMNGAGYLAGALFASPICRRFGDKQVFACGMITTALAIGASGLMANFVVLLGLRFVAGLTGGLAFIAGAALTAVAAAGGSRSRAPTLLGVYFSGGGLGIIASALAVPPVLAAAGWRGGWVVLGALALLATGFGVLVLRRAPTSAHLATGRQAGDWSPRVMRPTLIAYALFGAGYIAYATFIVALLRTEGLSNGTISMFWTVLGLAAVVGAFVWGPVLGRLAGGGGATATIGVVAIGSVTPLLWSGVIGAYVSAMLFGSSFLAVIAAVTSVARRAAKPSAWSAAIATLTVVFGLGQCIGPVLSGALSDGRDGLRAGLWLSVVILTVAALVAAFQPEPNRGR